MSPAEKQNKTLQDMLQGAINQRNNAQNECVQLSASLQEANREIERQAGEIAALTKKLAEATADDKSPDGTARANGHAEEMSVA